MNFKAIPILLFSTLLISTAVAQKPTPKKQDKNPKVASTTTTDSTMNDTSMMVKSAAPNILCCSNHVPSHCGYNMKQLKEYTKLNHCKGFHK